MQEEISLDRQNTWGLWYTVLWGVCIYALLLITQIGLLLLYAVYISVSKKGFPVADITGFLDKLQFDGLFLSLCLIATTMVCCPAVLGVVKLKRGADIREYLGLTIPAKFQSLRWFLIFTVLLAFSDVISILSGKPIVPEFMTKAYSSMGQPWLLWVALLLAAPLFEELFFRGFLLKGLAASRLGSLGAVIITSAAWALIHLQYDIYGIASIFVLGLILGAARIRTGSTLLAMFLHLFCNLVAATETVLHLSGYF